MADNTDKENIDTQTENQSESSPGEITPTNDTETITQNQETENMEVHHHAHHEGKRYWKSYFWEFLMLFLAVFCGFFAEYLLEHKIERDREKQYMESMVEDLIADTTMLNRLVNRAIAMGNKMDSLKTFLYDVNNVESNKLIIYRLNAESERRYFISFSDQTATQLRYSGGMRLIRKVKIANAISRYSKECSNLEFTAGNFNNRSDTRDEMANDIFSRQFIIRLSRDTLTQLINYSTNPGAQLMTQDKHLLLNYSNQISRLQESNERYFLPQVIAAKKLSINLIQLIRTEYHLN
jgi:hypothetical protein